MIDDVLRDADSRMKKAQEALDRELSTIRTGRASPTLLDRIVVEVYGSQLPINQVGTVTVPEATQLVIQPWDKASLGPIEKAIQKSDLGLNPTNDGQVIRLVIPALTEERRKEFVKQVHKRVEDARVAVRNVRRDASDKLKHLEKDKEISSDDLHRAGDQLEKLTHRHVDEVDKLGQRKESDLLAV